jgi:lysyl-tRNA synthetase class 1
MFARKAPTEAFDISLGNDVPRIYGEFDKIYDKYFDDRNSLDELTLEIMDMVVDGQPKSSSNVPFGILSTLYSISNGKVEMIEEMFKKIGMNYEVGDLLDRLKKVSYWLENYSPDTIIKLRTSPDVELFDTLSPEIQSWVAAFCKLIKNDNNFNAEELMTHLYAIPKDPALDDKANKDNQLLFFRTMYKLLIGKERGPMLSTLVLALGAENILPIVEPLVAAVN